MAGAAPVGYRDGMETYRLSGGPRDGEVTDTLPPEYAIPDPDIEGDEGEDPELEAEWVGDEMIVLTVGPDLEGGQLIRRADAPDDAYETSVTVRGDGIDGGEPGVEYEVWSVD